MAYQSYHVPGQGPQPYGSFHGSNSGYHNGPGMGGPGYPLESGPMSPSGPYHSNLMSGGSAVSVDNREFFLNVTLDEADRAQHGANALAREGRLQYGRAGSLVGGLLGSITGGFAVKDQALVEDVGHSIAEATMECLRRDGWEASVQIIALPPVPGSTEWKPYIPFGPTRSGTFMVMRARFLRPTNKTYYGNGGFLETLSGCCSSCCQAEPPIYGQWNSQTLVPDIQSTLRLISRKPINAFIDLACASEEINLLHAQGWSPELAIQTIQSARRAPNHI
mmetsp:Transcript_56504/g.122140  ORF Transcript_56504/g.122140 Transcript_56504/m.122140 type:complete len:278 (-) Transcript_56504:66-899(-)